MPSKHRLPENLPLKKRRIYRNPPSHIDLDRLELLQLHLPSPPLSPQVDAIKHSHTSEQKNQILFDHSPTTTSTWIAPDQRTTDASIDEHFRKSLGEEYERLSNVLLTTVESTSGSIDEHFARSLGKSWPLTHPSLSFSSSSLSSINNHFAQSLGVGTWEKMKEKSDRESLDKLH